MVGIADEFVEHGAPSLLREKYGLTGAAVAKRAVDVFSLARTALVIQ